ncbi:MAG: DUF7282 domain-containing protein [Anaerolineae bacterium]
MKPRPVLSLFVVLVVVAAGALALAVSPAGSLTILAQDGAAPSPELVERGEQVALDFGCLTCHTTTGARLIGPSFLGLYGSEVRLNDGSTAFADETFIRGEIVAGHERTVLDYPAGIMPDYGGLIPGEDVDALVAWIVSLGQAAPPAQQMQDLTPTPGPVGPMVPGGAESPFMVGQDDQETATQLWQFLQDSGYQDNWSTVPGKGMLYRGQDPHGALLTTYLNPVAGMALQERPGLMPNGSIIVKENYTEDETLVAISVAAKLEGYNPDHNDWFWASFGPDGEVDMAGAVPGCISCHGAVWSNDYIFTFPVAPIDPSQPRPRTADEPCPLPGVPTTPTPAAPEAEVTPTPVPTVDVTPSVTVQDQPVVANSVVIDEVVSRGPGWMVIHADSNGSPGPVIGYAIVNPGVNPDVVVELNLGPATPVLHAMLHDDTGEIGVYEFPGGDPPSQFPGQMLTVPFQVLEAPAGPPKATPVAPAETPKAPAETPMASAKTPMAPAETPKADADLVALGRQVAQNNGCLGCHSADGSTLLGPTLLGLFGSTVPLADGSMVVADEEYIRRSIVDPNAQIVRGFPAGLMPGDFGQRLDEMELDALVELIRSLGSGM